MMLHYECALKHLNWINECHVKFMHLFLCSCSQLFYWAQDYEHRTWNHSLLICCALSWRSPCWMASQVGLLPAFSIYLCVWAFLSWLQCHIKQKNTISSKNQSIPKLLTVPYHLMKSWPMTLFVLPFVSNWYQRIKGLPLRESAVWSHRRTAVAQN